MKAAVFHGSQAGLKIEDVPKPTPGDNDILVKVAACGVCHTDLHYIDHGVPTFKEPPLILGHEASGTVAGLGKNVKDWKEGDRVLLPAVLTCGACEYCRTGRENICLNMIMFGNNIDGSYAEYVVSPAKDAIPLPEEIPLEEGSIIADAISTPYHAVKVRGKVEPGSRVIVFGCGGVGINVVQVAAAVGANVVAVDMLDEKLALARKLGAQATLNPVKEENPGKALRKLTKGGAHVAFEVIGKSETMELAFGCVRTGGRLVIVGYTNKNISVNAGRIMYREMEILGSLGCRPVDYPPLIEMVKIGKIKVAELVTQKFPLEHIQKAFELLRSGDVNTVRSVVTP